MRPENTFATKAGNVGMQWYVLRNDKSVENTCTVWEHKGKVYTSSLKPIAEAFVSKCVAFYYANKGRYKLS